MRVSETSLLQGIHLHCSRGRANWYNLLHYFITRGIAWTYTTRNNNGETTGSSHAECLEKGHFFGEELIQWGLGEASLSNLFRLPLSSKVVKSHTKVEAFALMADDLRNIVSRTKFRVSEEELETKAASMFQAALRCKKEKSSQSSTSGSRDGAWVLS